MEALRQSSPQRGARGADLAAAAELGAVALSRVLDPGHHRDRPDTRRIVLLAGPSAKTPGSVVGTARDLEPARRIHAALAGRLYAGVPSLRGILQPGRDRAHSLADVGSAPAAGMERVRRRRSKSRKQPGGVLAGDVDRAGGGAWRPGLSHGLAANRIAGGLAGLGTLGHEPKHRLVDQPACAAPGVAFDGRTDRLPAQARPQDLGLL